MSHSPGVIRDSIVHFLGAASSDVSTEEITAAVRTRLGNVPASSVRSYLNLNTPGTFERTKRGRYRLQSDNGATSEARASLHSVSIERATLYRWNCFDWLAQQAPASIHAIVTDPPYGLIEYTAKEKQKLRAGSGGVWRIPPSFDGHRRSPLPRFTILRENDHRELQAFFTRFAVAVRRIVVPGANVVIASNPLLVHLVSDALVRGGLELRGYIARQVMTMRGGDRPKNAHREFEDVSVMPRSQWEPWVVARAPLDGRVQDNLRRWKTGGFRRISGDKPFGDLISSHPTPAAERRIAPHPSLKPQAFMRQVVRAVLPLGEGIVLDPFMGAGSTLAAANRLGYESIGIELDEVYFDLAVAAVPLLSRLSVKGEA